MPTALITGASRGLGFGIARRFEASGYEIIGPTRDHVDLGDPESVDRYAKTLNGRHIDVLVNNAGINRPVPLGETALTELQNHIDVNVVSAFLLSRSVGEAMGLRGKGRIVNIGSIYGTLSRERRAMYSTTKAALEGLTRATAVELGPSGVLANALCPGFVDSPLTRANNTPEQVAAFEQAIPLRRLATLTEIAELAYFLGSSENTYITGQSIVIDGGFSCQ